MGWLSWFLPLLPLTRELRTYLPDRIWKVARGRMIRLNIHQMLMLLKWKHPVFRGLFSTVRRVDRLVGNS